MRALLVAGLAATSCTFANAVDVCSRGEHAEQQANVLTEGQQALGGAQALAALPNGRVLLAFTSRPLEAGSPELRATLLGADAAPVPICDQPNEATLAPASGVQTLEVAVAGAATDAQASLVVWGAGSEIRGLFLTNTGCAEAPAFRLSTPVPDSQYVQAPAVARIDEQTFAVTWTEVVGGFNVYPRVRARLVRHQVASVVEFPPTVLEPTGAAFDLASGGSRQYLSALTATGGGQLALAWFESGQHTAVRFAVFDDRFHEVSAPRTIAQTNEMPADFQQSAPSLACAFDGRQVLVAWSLREPGAPKRVLARLFAPDGRALSAPAAPDGAAFRLGSTANGDESQVTALGLLSSGGGFLVAWTETGGDGHSDTDGAGLRAVGLDVGGALRFSNRACGETDFALNRGAAGDQTQPSLALTGGTFIGAWSDSGHDGLDRSGLGVRAAAWSERDLFALP